MMKKVAFLILIMMVFATPVMAGHGEVEGHSHDHEEKSEGSSKKLGCIYG